MRSALVLQVILLGWAAPLAAQTLEGRVVLGPAATPVSGATVELHRVTSSAGEIADSTTSAVDGSFSFALPEDSDPVALWLAAARNEGVLYFGPATHAGQVADGEYTVVLYESTIVEEPPTDLRLAVRHLVVTPGTAGGYDVAEVMDIVGPPGVTLVPASDTMAIWSSSLPSSARGPRAIQGGVPTEAVSFADGEVRLNTMLSPSGARVTFVYATERPDLEIRIDHPTDRLDIVVYDPSAAVTGARPANSVVRNGQELQRYELTDIAPGAVISISSRVSEPVGGRPIWWGLLGLVLLSAAAGLWWWDGRSAR
jgi:hypothetical protein